MEEKQQMSIVSIEYQNNERARSKLIKFIIDSIIESSLEESDADIDT